ncbi:MAG: type II toxin-antitoxin system RelE/ParE family toxin [Bacteroidota bacterium]|nr:type II toxin-antitoxin system RelE/ParE family toxin [Bacteroidota bacterium]
MQEYLLLNWYDSVAKNFNTKLTGTIKLLSQQPNLGSKVKGLTNTRTILITKHNRLYYRIDTDKLIITNILDTRRNPENNRFNKSK